MIQPCADAIAFYNNKLVLVERLSAPLGLALPGGRLDPNESLEECVVREMHEETHLDFTIDYQFRTYSDPHRDPRGQKISTVYVGTATGIPQGEKGKTNIVLIDPSELNNYKEQFVCDHYQILCDYFSSRK